MALDGLGNYIQVTFITNFSMVVAKRQLADIRSKQFCEPIVLSPILRTKGMVP